MFDIGSKVKEVYNSAKEKSGDIAKAAGIGIVSTLMYAGLADKALGQETRYVNFDADPAAFGINGETIDMTEFKIQYFKIPSNNDMVGFRMHNPSKPNDYVEIRGIIPLAEGETYTHDWSAVLPYITVDPSTLGGSGTPTEMPGSNPGIDNIYEINSANNGESKSFKLNNNQGTVNMFFDLDSDYFPTQIGHNEIAVLKWNETPTGYNMDLPLTSFNTYHSNEGEPTGWEPEQSKNWRIFWLETSSYDGQTDQNNATIRYSKQGADISDIESEQLQAMTKCGITPFFNATMGPVPEGYRLMVGIQNHSDIKSESYNIPVPNIPIGFLSDGEGHGYGMYAPNADDGSGVFPGSININDLVQHDYLDANGSRITPIFSITTPIKNENGTLSEFKLRYK